MAKKSARQTYEYFRNKLLKEAKREGLTTQEEKLLKIIEVDPNKLDKKEISKRATKIKAEFKRIRQTKLYKSERRLRNQLYRVVNKYNKEEIEREARRRLRNLPPAPDQLRSAYFKNLTFKILKEKGITRNINGKIVKYEGFEAVKKQITALADASNSEKKKQLYIRTYINNLIENGIPEDYTYTDAEGNEIVRYPIVEMERYLQSLAPKVLTFALDMGHIPSIQYYYVITESDIEAFIQKIDYWTSDEANTRLQESYKITDEQTQKMVKIIRKERELMEKVNLPKRPNKNY